MRTIGSSCGGRNYCAMGCAAIAGAGLAFLWFNIKPAKFYMGDV